MAEETGRDRVLSAVLGRRGAGRRSADLTGSCAKIGA
jgi:hypothetical protein